ncbi:dimethyl sulfoxide reductase anchor subunit family protein [Pasteurellaceae bacterium 22721_9_1]
MNGLHELPLIIFTVLSQSVVGAFLLFTLTLCSAQDKHYRAYVHKAMFVLLLLQGVAFVASITHLGSPLRAFNSLNRIGESMMSNEIASGALFFALAGLYWLIAITGKMPKALGNLWLILTALVGLAFMFFMNQTYHIATVPTWNTVFTSWNFYLTVVIAGFALGYALLQSDRPDARILKWVPTAVGIGLLLAAVVAIYQGFSFGHIITSAQKANALVPDFAVLTAIRVLCIGLGVALLFWALRKPTGAISKVLAVLLIFGAEFIGRSLFYALHMTAGTAIGA